MYRYWLRMAGAPADWALPDGQQGHHAGAPGGDSLKRHASSFCHSRPRPQRPTQRLVQLGAGVPRLPCKAAGLVWGLRCPVLASISGNHWNPNSYLYNSPFTRKKYPLVSTRWSRRGCIWWWYTTYITSLAYVLNKTTVWKALVMF